jgi:exopolysaccharide production negative regulator
MRTSDELARVIVIALGLGLGPTVALDGTPSDGPAAVSIDRVTATPGAPAASVAVPTRGIDVPRSSAALPGAAPASRAPMLSPVEAFRSGTQALRAGEKAKAVTSLQYAAEQGHALAQWKLGRMYAEGDGVERSDLRAFQYFRGIADAYADDSPGTPQARFVANAFVALGHYYLEGIPDSPVKADAVRAHEMFSYAASYFRDPDAQYYLARLYLDGKGSPRDPRQAARWLSLAANKGQHQAQALLGRMLFKGEDLTRQPGRGLMWLTLARDAATADEKWIAELYDSAFRQATDDERALALVMLERWIKGRRD